MKPSFFKGIVLGAATSMVVFMAASAVAGTGVGGIFNLGQANTVNASTSLSGANGAAGLNVTNTAAAGSGVVGAHTAATGTPPGVQGTTASTSANAIGVSGIVSPTAPGTDAAAVRGENKGTNANGYGVWGSHAGSGVGVYGTGQGGAGVLGEGTSGTGVVGTATTGSGVRGLTQGGRGVWGQNNAATRSVNGDMPGVFGGAFADDGGQFSSTKGTGAVGTSSQGTGLVGNGLDGVHGNGDPSFGTGGVFTGGSYGVIAKSPGTGVHSESPYIAVYGKNQGGTGIGVYGSSSSGYAGKFSGPVQIDGTLTLNGQLNGCGPGTIDGFGLVSASAAFSSSYTTLPVRKNCTGALVLARRVSTGIYYVRFVGVGSILATGSVANSDEDDFIAVDKRLDPLDNQPSFRVAVRDADGGTEDRAFTILTF
jgi:hypothetical protein